ncbi:hypothetical protein CYME_CMO191C [Cyanidioschyzon merolae strain 10D]|uniref:ATP-binding cassette domain-containing protein n=1 Tax=Cyanidioschyzon merolae (strain NIES-3377 / 10D) TaxID=280699 RepID=M1VF15_CYAM1|nr:hypothetical protein CYME_CMO191C [Cyanidioschyzon merolae strain 10D]BAM81547.1 hypothetical protein CYME_CMO191C [Cyanidioschyzon merolae strain 10D]|eukprot:XP_005537583.1 hypothetical protein CYME_CMO191C [Cyanidioschyzon merolae strain 10D]
MHRHARSCSAGEPGAFALPPGAHATRRVGGSARPTPEASQSYLLRLEHVHLSIPGSERLLLRDLTLHVHRGEHTLIEAPSGAGKSALVRALRGNW